LSPCKLEHAFDNYYMIFLSKTLSCTPFDLCVE
jgi:hypothetical protein